MVKEEKTQIEVSKVVRGELNKQKLLDRESYNSVIKRLIKSYKKTHRRI